MPTETTPLDPLQEVLFQKWAQDNKLQPVDHPDSHYDMRGYWKAIASHGGDQTEINPQDHLLHFPDTFKQHGHPTFSQESKYSQGPWDGGMWVNPSGGTIDPLTTLLQQPKLAVSH